MDTDGGVRKLVELIFSKKPTIPEERVAHSSIPTSLLNEDFSKKLAIVLRWRKHIVFRRWNHMFDGNNRDKFSSHEGYLLFVMCTCIKEHECNQNIFDSFISVCVVLSYLSEETLSKVGLDFRDLNPDIIMVFYRHVLKRSSLKREEFNRFVEYILGHKYLEWNLIQDSFNLCNDLTASVPDELDEKIEEELNRHCDLLDEVKSRMRATAVYLMEEILSNTSVKLPTIPSEPVLIRRLIASFKKEMEKKAERERRGETALTISHENSISNSDSKTDHFVDQQKDSAWHENIIEAVIRHNHSKNFGHGNTHEQIFKEADSVLEHLKNTITYLTDVLDERNQE